MFLKYERVMNNLDLWPKSPQREAKVITRMRRGESGSEGAELMPFRTLIVLPFSNFARSSFDFASYHCAPPMPLVL